MSPLANFFDAFGYVVIRKLFDRSLQSELQDAYDTVVTTHFGKSMEEFLRSPTLVLAGLETSQPLLTFLQNSRILPVVEELLGDDVVFWGSDLSTFVSPSQFHRDLYGDFRMLKVAIYLQDSTAQDGGQFCCIPGTHHFGDRYADLCSQGLRWPNHGAGYTPHVLTGEFDLDQRVPRDNIPALGVELAVGDAVFFNHALIHAVPASNRPRRMIAISFFEGEKSFNARPRAPGEFTGLSHAETLIALRLACYLNELNHGKWAPLNYHEKLGGLDIPVLRKYLREFSSEQFDDVNDRVFKRSYDAAHRFITKQNPVH
jgi:hypothetical protein